MKNLIVYFSYSGNTEKIVKQSNKNFGYDVVQIERKVPYSDDYDTCAYGEAKEEYEKKLFPEIKEINIDYSKYDNILLFFPIWWYTIPRPIATFVKGLKGYNGAVYVFANSYTNDFHYMENSMNELKSLDNKLNFKEGLFNKNVNSHIEFLNKIK